MEYLDFLEQVIERGIAAAAESYADDPSKRDGAIAGFKACRGLQPEAILVLLMESNRKADEARRETGRLNLNEYWYRRCFALEVEWVANCVSAVLQNQGMIPIVTPTARGYINAAEILGVKEQDAGP